MLKFNLMLSTIHNGESTFSVGTRGYGERNSRPISGSQVEWGGGDKERHPREYIHTRMNVHEKRRGEGNND
jgi:hypothetical protein